MADSEPLLALSLFPPELWDVIEPDAKRRKTLKPKSAQRGRGAWDAGSGAAEGLSTALDPATAADGAPRPPPAVAEDDDEPPANVDDRSDNDDAEGEEDPDENFEEGDSDMGGDYDAEQYFDGGEEEAAEGGGEEGEPPEDAYD